MKKVVGDTTDMEHDTEEGPDADVIVIEEEGPGGKAIDSEKDSGRCHRHGARYRRRA